MRKIINLAIALLVTVTISAQRKVEKSERVSKNQEVFVHFKFAQNIVVKQWNQNKVEVRATVNINNGEGNKHFSLKSSKRGNQVKVYSDYGNYFKRQRTWSNNNRTEIDYVVYVPKNVRLKVKSISGSVEAENYAGILNLDLISGNITVKKHSKDMHLKTISGDIDIFITDATFEAKSLTGGIYSDLDIDFDKKKKSRSYGSKITATINKGTASLKLNTISGDIFLRKI